MGVTLYVCVTVYLSKLDEQNAYFVILHLYKGFVTYILVV